jgi:hypothetical protein
VRSFCYTGQQTSLDQQGQMRIFRKSFIITAVFLFCGAPQTLAGAMPEEAHGQLATNYLELLDQHQFQNAWQSMAPLFWSFNDQQRWQQRIGAIRQAYGGTVSRKISRSSYRASFRNAPDGSYVIIQFDSTFQHKAKGVETVVLQCPVENECTVIDYVIN